MLLIRWQRLKPVEKFRAQINYSLNEIRHGRHVGQFPPLENLG